MIYYLKCYYGYKNLGDELLFFGVLKRIVTRYKPTKIIVEVGDISWRTSRLSRHTDIISDILSHDIDMQAISLQSTKTLFKKNIKPDYYIFGWGEVITDTLAFDRPITPTRRHRVLYIAHILCTRAGRNYLIKYRQPIRSKQVIRIWWFGSIHKISTWLLYRLTLPYAKDIVCRDKYSFDTVRYYYPYVQLHQDWSMDIIHHINSSTSHLSQPYILINCSYHKPHHQNIKKVIQRLSTYPDAIPIYVAMDRHHDVDGFVSLKDHIHNLQLYDRTTHNLSQICSLFAHAVAGIGERLHFLVLLQHYKKPFTVLTLSEKIHHLLEQTSL